MNIRYFIATLVTLALFVIAYQVQVIWAYPNSTFTNICGCGPSSSCSAGQRASCGWPGPGGSTCNIGGFSCNGAPWAVTWWSNGKSETSGGNESDGQSSFNPNAAGACGRTYQVDAFDHNCRSGGGWSCGNTLDYFVYYTGDCGVPATCPASVQARYHVRGSTIQGIPGIGDFVPWENLAKIYPADDMNNTNPGVSNFQTAVFLNGDTSQYFSGTVTLTDPNGVVTTISSAITSVPRPYKVGVYKLQASVGGNVCDNATVILNQAPPPPSCTATLTTSPSSITNGTASSFVVHPNTSNGVSYTSTRNAFGGGVICVGSGPNYNCTATTNGNNYVWQNLYQVCNPASAGGACSSCSATTTYSVTPPAAPPPTCNAVLTAPAGLTVGQSGNFTVAPNAPAGGTYTVTTNSFNGGLQLPCTPSGNNYNCLATGSGSFNWTHDYQVCNAAANGGACTSCTPGPVGYTISAPPGFLITTGGDVYVDHLAELSLTTSAEHFSTYSYLQKSPLSAPYVGKQSTPTYVGNSYTDDNNAPGTGWYSTILARVTASNPSDIKTIVGGTTTLALNSLTSSFAAGNKVVNISNNGNLVISSAVYCDSPTLFLISGTLTINPSFLLFNNASSACMFVVHGDITISPGANQASDEVDAFLVTDAKFTSSADAHLDPLLIKGGVITNTNTFARNTGIVGSPSETITYDGARYINQLNAYLTEPIDITVQEKQFTDILELTPAP